MTTSHGHATTILKINNELIMCANLCHQIPACPPKLADGRDKDLEACLSCQLVVGAIWANQSGTENAPVSLYEWTIA